MFLKKLRRLFVSKASNKSSNIRHSSSPPTTSKTRTFNRLPKPMRRPDASVFPTQPKKNGDIFAPTFEVSTYPDLKKQAPKGWSTSRAYGQNAVHYRFHYRSRHNLSAISVGKVSGNKKKAKRA